MRKQTYNEVMEMIMKPKPTLEDWKRFRFFMDQLKPPHFENPELSADEAGEIVLKRSHDYAEAARHVAAVLTWEEINQDDMLIFAYYELKDRESKS